MTDLITSLRALAAARHDDLSVAVDAVIEIERLRADNERLRKALQDIAEDCDDDYPPSHGAIKYAVQDALRDKP